MSNSEEERRNLARDSIFIPAIITGRESTEDFWEEDSDLINVSRIGASFKLGRAVSPGRLVLLQAKMPGNLRAHDFKEEKYRVWGLVQHCGEIVSGDETGFQIGVAFVGKEAPGSYADDPRRSYRISGMNEDGFWEIAESKTPFVQRAHHRFKTMLDARLALVDQDGKETLIDHDAVTENIGAGGVSVFSNLSANIGESIMFYCDRHKFSAICVVRNRQNRAGGRASLHLGFADAEFPVKELEAFSENPGENI